MLLINLFARRQWRHIEKRLMDTVGKGEGGRNGKSSVETYMTICKIDSQWEHAVWIRDLRLGVL